MENGYFELNDIPIDWYRRIAFFTRPELKMTPKSTDSVQEYLKKLCEGAHGKFVDYVKQQRGNKIKNDPATFSGDVFTGQEAQ